MQDEVQIELGEGEEILAEGEKNNVLCVCFMILLCVSVFVFGYEAFTANHVSMRAVCAMTAIFMPFLINHLLNSFKYNQIYLTDKRFIITQKDKIECVPYEEIHSFIGNDTVYLESKRKFFFAFTNLEEVKQTFKEIYPQHKQPLFTLKDAIFIVFVIFFILIVKFMPNYLYKIQAKLTPQKQEQTEIKDKNSYMQYLQKTLKLHWAPPKLENSAKVVVEFEILKDGSIINEKITETSGSRELDNSALFAVRKSNPLRNLPEDLKNEKEVKINFTFDYNNVNE